MLRSVDKWKTSFLRFEVVICYNIALLFVEPRRYASSIPIEDDQLGHLDAYTEAVSAKTPLFSALASKSLMRYHEVVNRDLSRPSQEIELTLRRVVARNDHPGELLVPGETTRPEALEAVAVRLWVPEDIFVPVHAVRSGNGLVPAIAVLSEGNGDDFVPVGRFTVPRAVESNEKVLVIAVKLGVEWSGMGLEGQTGRCRELFAGSIVEGAVWRGKELRSGLRVAIGKQFSSPDGKARWVSVPFLVRDGRVTD